MKSPKSKNTAAKSLWTSRAKTITPRAINLSQEELVSKEHLTPGQGLPLVIQPLVNGLKLQTWAANNTELIESSCSEFGAVLFRGFGIHTASEFEEVIKAISGSTMEYRERSSPRSQVSGNIYTSTDYPADQSIFPHNEHSYSLVFPLKLYFCCLAPAETGGETPLADTRKIFRRISQGTREKFIQRKWMYVRNFGDGFGLRWQVTFQTDDKAAVEAYCRNLGIENEWREGGRLRTRQVRPAVVRHPGTGEMAWFNHATFFHVSTLEPGIREALLKEFKVGDLANNTYYGDGSEIEPSVLDELREAYLKECVMFRWEKGDVLVLDNVLTAHARRPFTGHRKVVFGMAEPHRRTDV